MRFLFWLFPLIFSLAVQAEEFVNCYDYEVETPHAESEIEVTKQTWCYKEVQEEPGTTFIYNVDRDPVRPELAMVVEPSGFLVHASLLAGEMTVHRVPAQGFSPFAIPTHEPMQMSFRTSQKKPYTESAKKVLDYLRKNTPQTHSFALPTTSSTVWNEEASANKKPWRGYWWPYSNGPLWSGSDSPLAKYDRLVESLTGNRSSAVSWERSNHGYRGVSWEGHCNGWAAAAILRAEPRTVKNIQGIEFKVSDQKGLLSVRDYCADAAFFGSRYGRGGDRSDIYPAEFHKTLKHYIGGLGKPIVMDHRSDGVVDNHIISGYKMQIEKISANRYDVQTTLTVHKYDKSNTEAIGVAPTYDKKYSYIMTTNQNNEPTGGYWKSGNPDFFWVPLSSVSCSSHNPNVEEEMVQKILGR